MPTKHPRHAVTETPEVKAALDSVRAATGEARPNLAELLILGAEVKTRRVAAQRDGTAMGELLDMVLGASIPVDVDAADAVKRLRL